MIIQLPIPRERNLLFSKDVTNDSIAELTKNLIDISNNDAYIEKIYKIHGILYSPNPIKIYIDSYGGQVYQGLGLINVIKNCTTPVHTIVTGCAMSCGLLISISGHKRFGYKHSTFMHHQVSSCKWGVLKDIEEDIVEVKRLQTIIEKHVLEKTKITKEQLKQNYEKKKDWYMTSVQALKFGIIDELI